MSNAVFFLLSCCHTPPVTFTLHTPHEKTLAPSLTISSILHSFLSSNSFTFTHFLTFLYPHPDVSSLSHFSQFWVIPMSEVRLLSNISSVSDHYQSPNPVTFRRWQLFPHKQIRVESPVFFPTSPQITRLLGVERTTP